MNTAITDLLPVQSNIHGTPFEDLINNTIGYFLELIEEEVDRMNDGCFIDTAEGKYLDLWGKDFGIPRLNDETDEDYRKRLQILPLEHFTIQTLYELYDAQLLTHPWTSSNYLPPLKLLSDNHLLPQGNVNNKIQYYIGCSDEAWAEIQKKFVTYDVLFKVE